MWCYEGMLIPVELQHPDFYLVDHLTCTAWPCSLMSPLCERFACPNALMGVQGQRAQIK